MKGKTKKALLAVTCVALVAVMTVAGTFAYFQDTSEDVVNTFNPNSVHVELTETDEKGETVYGRNDYSIVPGTWQKKDPKVTVEATLPSYVYLEVIDTANTDGKTLIDYAIVTGDDGWTPLEGYANVYYREFTPETDESGKLITTAEYQVLVSNKVSYPASLTNEDMYTTETGDDGNEVSVLRSDIKLSFKAAAIQKEGFTPESGWLQIPVEVSTVEEFEDALKNGTDGKPVQLAEDIELTKKPAIEDDVIIDLNDHTLTAGSAASGIVLNDASLTLENGTFKWEGTDRNTVAVALESGSELTLDHVEVITNATINVESGSDPVSLNIIDSTITSTDYYCVSTNAANNTTGENVEINVVNSTLTVNETRDEYNDSAAILFNVPGKLNITNSNLTADRQAVIVRCGTAVIQDSTLTCTGKFSGSSFDEYDNKIWGSGNEVPVAVLVVGNRSSAGAYPYDASCTLEDTVLSIPENSNRSAIYAAAYNGHTTTLTFVGYDEDTVESLYITSIEEGSTFTVEPR